MMPITNASVEIEVVNKTQNITLRSPRTYCMCNILKDPQDLVPPGSSSSCKFTRGWWIIPRECTGVLAYEADSFTMAIYFYNPIHHEVLPLRMGLELSLDRIHRWDLETTYCRLESCCKGSSDTSTFPCVILKDFREEVQLSHGPVTVTVTVARGRRAVIRVEVEERKESGEEAEGGKPRDVEGDRPTPFGMLWKFFRT